MTEVPVERLRPNPWNTNHATPENEEKLDRSIRELGCYKPIVVRTLEDGMLEILGGEHRWASAKRVGLSMVPIVNLGRVDEKTAKKIGLIDNGRYGEDDGFALAELLKEFDLDEITGLLPYSEFDIETIFAHAETVPLDDLTLPDDPAGGASLDDSSLGAQTHQLLRFKVPIEDAATVTLKINAIAKSQGFDGDDSMTNAGNALVFIMSKL